MKKEPNHGLIVVYFSKVSDFGLHEMIDDARHDR